MKPNYADILNNISEKPLWWDENGVPRYCEFHPMKVTDLNANEVALIQIACRSCGSTFTSCISDEPIPKVIQPSYEPIKERILYRELHYGHPPNVGCCKEGPMLISVPIKVFQYWYRPRNWEKETQWIREPALELNIKPIWL